jgi:glycosyltransferase involved in cell wall biosynthesis
MESHLRICEVILSPSYGGAETMALLLSERVRRAGHDVDIVALDPATGPRPDRANDIEIVTSSRLALGHRLRRADGARRLFRERDYDLIQAHTFLPDLYSRLGALLARSRAPVVLTLQSGADDYSGRQARLVERALLRRTSAVVAVSERLAHQYSTHFPERANDIHVIPNGVATPPTRPSPPSSPAVFAVVGRIFPIKDVETAIRGFARFASSDGGREATLLIIGPDSDPAYAARMRAVAAQLPEADVRFRGAVLDPFESERIDVLIHSSEHEAHSVTLLEAAARRIPIVCSDVPSIEGAIGGNCRAFPVGDAAALAEALAATARDWPGSLARAERAAAYAPSIDEATAQYLSLFESLVASNGSAA